MKYNISALAMVFCGLAALYQIHVGNSLWFATNAILSAINAGFAFERGQ